jgi:hypothetical protein
VPARPSGKGRFGEDQAIGSAEGKMKSGTRREVEQGLTAFVQNFQFCNYPWEGGIRRNFDVNVGALTEEIFNKLARTSEKTFSQRNGLKFVVVFL